MKIRGRYELMKKSGVWRDAEIDADTSGGKEAVVKSLTLALAP